MPGRNQVTDKDRGWDAILGVVDAIRGGAYVKVGLLGGDDGGGLHEPGSNLTTTEIGIVNEFGTADGRIPERSFLRATFDKKREEIAQMAFKLLLGVIDRKMSVEKALNILGSWFATEVRKYITEGAGVPPPNAASTLKAKRAAGEWNKGGKAQSKQPAAEPRTLVNTMTLVRSITWAIITSRKGRKPIE